MERRYSIDLYYRLDQVEGALRELVNFADVISGDKVTLKLKNDVTLRLPLRGYEPELQRWVDTIYLDRATKSVLHLALLFQFDRAIYDYMYDPHYPEPIVIKEGQKLVSLGAIYLIIRCGKEYARFAFTAVTSQVSDLFVGSRTIRHRFLDFAATTGSLAQAIDRQTSLVALHNPNITLSVEKPPIPIESDTYIDEYTQALLASLNT